jgi:integrase
MSGTFKSKSAAPAKLPGYCRQKRKGKADLAFVEIDGVRRYLGEYGSDDSRQRYQAVIEEWQASGFIPPADVRDIPVVVLVDMYWTHAKDTYKKPDGTPTNEPEVIKRSMADLLALYGSLPAKDFSPLKLKAVRNAMVKQGWCRNTVNSRVQRIKRMFAWAVENELVPASIHHALDAVAGLKIGRSDAPESEPVGPVADHLVDGTLNHVSPQVKAMIQLQRLTGARPGEVCTMRTCGFDTTGKVWTYKPASHKTQHHGHQRTIYLGPKAQDVVSPFLKLDTQAFIFSAAEAGAWHRQQRHKNRTTPMSCGNVPGDKQAKKPKRKAGDRFTVTSYRRAIVRATEDAFPPPADLARRQVPSRRANRTTSMRWETDAEWLARLTDEQKKKLADWRQTHQWHPNQLRHTAGTELRKQYGLEAAQVILGHKTLTVTQVYAEKNVEAARKIMAEVG